MPFELDAEDFDDSTLWAAVDAAPPPRPRPAVAAPRPVAVGSRERPPATLNLQRVADADRGATAPDHRPAPGARPPLHFHPTLTTNPHRPTSGGAPVEVHRGNYENVRAADVAPLPRHVRVELALEKSNGRVAVATVPPGVFDEHLVAACKRIPGAAFDGRFRRWTFPDEHLAEATRTLKSAAGVVVELVPPQPVAQRTLAAMAQLERAAAKALRELEAPDADSRAKTAAVTRLAERLYSEKVPANIRESLFPFQEEGVKFGLARHGRVLIGDQMGLGKTVQALALMAAYESEWPALVLVPTSLRGAWESALQRWLSLAPREVASVESGSEGYKLASARVAIVPYSLVGKLAAKMAERRYQVVVCDESHFLKDQKSQRTKSVLPLLKAARRAVCLTGTPALSRPVELFTQIHALRPNVFTKFTEFAQRYCAGARFGWQGCSHPDELFALISRLVMVRRLKKDVLTQLPPKQRTQVMLALPKSDALAEVKAINASLKAFRESARDAGVEPGTDGLGNRSLDERRLMNDLYRASAAAKARPVREYLETLADGGCDKFLFFAHHKVMLDAASELFEQKRVRHIRIDGSTPAKDRQKLVDTFQTDERCRVAVLSIKAAGMGLTMTAASVVVFGELSWTPGEVVQAEDRAHRIGQASSVNVQFLCAKNTVDDVMWGAVQNKLENLGQVLDGNAGECLELGGTTDAPARTREQRIETLAAYADRSPGGGPMRAGSASGAEEDDARRATRQGTLDAFIRGGGSASGGADRGDRFDERFGGAPGSQSQSQSHAGSKRLAENAPRVPTERSPARWRPPPEWERMDDEALVELGSAPVCR